MAEQFEFDFGQEQRRPGIPKSGTVGFNPSQDGPRGRNRDSSLRRARRLGLRGGVGSVVAQALPTDAQPGAIAASVGGRLAGGAASLLTPNTNIASGELDSPERIALLREQNNLSATDQLPAEFIADTELRTGRAFPEQTQQGVTTADVATPGAEAPRQTSFTNADAPDASTVSNLGGPGQGTVRSNVDAFDRATNAVRSLREAQNPTGGGGVAAPGSQFVREREARNARVGLRSALEDAGRSTKTKSQRANATQAALEEFRAAQPQAPGRARGIRGAGGSGRQTRTGGGSGPNPLQAFNAQLDLAKFRRQSQQDTLKQAQDAAKEARAQRGQDFTQSFQREGRRGEIIDPGLKGALDVAAGRNTPQAELTNTQLAQQFNQNVDDPFLGETLRLNPLSTDPVGTLVRGGFTQDEGNFLQGLNPFGNTPIGGGRFVSSPGGSSVDLSDLPQNIQDILKSRLPAAGR